MKSSELVDKLTERRKELGLSQRELAKRCNMPQSTIARIETHRITPQLDTIVTIADKLNFNLILEDRLKNKWDGSRISVYWKNELTAKVAIDGFNVTIEKFTDDISKQFFYAFDHMDMIQLSELLESRCWERERVGIEDILAKLGIEEYDPIEIVKRTFGVSYNDFIWFKFCESNITWEKICPRRKRCVLCSDCI